MGHCNVLAVDKELAIQTASEPDALDSDEVVRGAAALVSVEVRGCAGWHRGVAAWIGAGAGPHFFNGAFAFVGDIAFGD